MDFNNILARSGMALPKTQQGQTRLNELQNEFQTYQQAQDEKKARYQQALNQYGQTSPIGGYMALMKLFGPGASGEMGEAETKIMEAKKERARQALGSYMPQNVLQKLFGEGVQ